MLPLHATSLAVGRARAMICLLEITVRLGHCACSKKEKRVVVCVGTLIQSNHNGTVLGTTGSRSGRNLPIQDSNVKKGCLRERMFSQFGQSFGPRVTLCENETQQV